MPVWMTWFKFCVKIRSEAVRVGVWWFGFCVFGIFLGSPCFLHFLSVLLHPVSFWKSVFPVFTSVSPPCLNSHGCFHLYPRLYLVSSLLSRLLDHLFFILFIAPLILGSVSSLCCCVSRIYLGRVCFRFGLMKDSCICVLTNKAKHYVYNLVHRSMIIFVVIVVIVNGLSNSIQEIQWKNREEGGRDFGRHVAFSTKLVPGKCESRSGIMSHWASTTSQTPDWL